MRAFLQFIRNYPAALLLSFAYVFIAFLLLSYDHVWMHPEQFWIKSQILDQGKDLSLQDFQLGLNWNVFEYAPRISRPLSSYFEIIDTKFRVWLWQAVAPHPSLSLTWIFSLILSPIFMFRFLRNIKIDANTALAAVAFYLLSPGFLSLVVMLFRPAKAMTNFSIILCLFYASTLCKSSPPHCDKSRSFPSWRFAGFLMLMLISFFWDETALLIYPAVVLFFPYLLTDRVRLTGFLLIPVLALLLYTKFLPMMTNSAGCFDPIQGYGKIEGLFHERTFSVFIQNLSRNAALLIFDTLGIVKISPNSLVWFKLLGAVNCLCVITLSVLVVRAFYQQRRIPRDSTIHIELILWAFGLSMLILFHNLFMTVSNVIWGPYWYGTYWSVFFAIFLARLLFLSRLNKAVVFACLFFIQMNLCFVFIETNNIYKKYHYYPYHPSRIKLLFLGQECRFDPYNKPIYSGPFLKERIYRIWRYKGRGVALQENAAPQELKGILIELDHKNYRHGYPYLNDNDGYTIDL